jgi:hypothetical protein
MPAARALLGFLSIGFVGCATALELSVLPWCPSPAADVVLVLRESAPPPVILPQDPTITKAGNDYTILIEASTTVFSGQPPTSKTINLGKLPAGTYHADIFYRFTYPDVTIEARAGSVLFEVMQDPPNAGPCAASVISPLGPALRIASPGTAFAEPLQVLVTDGQLRPVPGAKVVFERVARPDDRWLAESAQPATVPATVEAVTDAAGIARANVAANGVSGPYQYAARIKDSAALPAWFALVNRLARDALPSTTVAVVEYFNAARTHYFITANPAEAAVLDDATLPGWTRTGGVFLALDGAAAQTTGAAAQTEGAAAQTEGAAAQTEDAAPVCRFYGRPEAGLDSHFYSASTVECAEVQARFSHAWLLETDRAFAVWLPDVATGACPAATRPLYRVYNGRPDANHRYTASTGVVRDMVSALWIPEGYGPHAVAMCVLE